MYRKIFEYGSEEQRTIMLDICKKIQQAKDDSDYVELEKQLEIIRDFFQPKD